MYDQAKQDQLRKLWRFYFDERDRREAAYRKKHRIPDDEEYVFGVNYPPFPEALRGLTCGAKTRKGTPCKNGSLYRNGRCKFHGGLSTGPKTPEGKKKCADNGRKSVKKKTAEADPMDS